jgi:hypothetical protein
MVSVQLVIALLGLSGLLGALLSLRLREVSG